MHRTIVCLLVVAAAACSGIPSGVETAPPDAGVDAAPPPPDAAVDAPLPPADAAIDAAPPPLDVPASLIKALGDKTYVEGTCTPTTYPGWPFDARRCTYGSGLAVTIANPPPDRVARWIVDASTLITS